MTEYDFFKKSVLLICENLQIEKSLFNVFKYFKEIMPVQKIFLQVFDSGLISMKTIAIADDNGGKLVDFITPFSEKAKAQMKQAETRNLPAAFILNEPEKYHVSGELLKFHNTKASSIIVVSLISKDFQIGSLVLTTEFPNVFNEKHRNLVSLLMEPFTIALSNTLKHREVVKLKEILNEKNKFLENELQKPYNVSIIGTNFGLKHVMEQVNLVAQMNTPVLILGETGVGKDLIANAIHQSSKRRHNSFISVNCGAIPENLIDSELFGHEKGAFTGAINQKLGRFERAQNGTIFLDEIGELPLNLQVRLLRVIQNKEFERIGGNITIPLNVRIIAATNQNLEELVKKKRFRDDLWFRLNVFPITVPPLRERKMDIPALVQHFVSKKSKQLKLSGLNEMAAGAISKLIEYNWPGNVRELENIIERELILQRNKPLSFDTLKSETDELLNNSTAILTLNKMTYNHIKSALQFTNGKIHGPGGAAEILGVNPNTLRNRMTKLGIKYKKKH